MKLLFTILLISSMAYGQDTSCVLDGSKSIGQRFKWSQTSGNKAVLKTPDSLLCEADSLQDGVYVFKITAYSGTAQSTDSTTITVSEDALSIQDNNYVKPVHKKPEFDIKVTPELKIKISSDKPQEIRIILSDVEGRKLEVQDHFLLKGDNYFQLLHRETGIYFLNFWNETINQPEKIFVR